MASENENRRLNLGLKFRTAGSSGKKLHVMSRKGQWVVFKEGADKVISEYATKRSAILNGKKLISSSLADALVVHKADGTVEKVQLAE